MTNFERDFAAWDVHFEEYRALLKYRYRDANPQRTFSRVEKFWDWLRSHQILPRSLQPSHYWDYIKDLENGVLCKTVEKYSGSSLRAFRQAALSWVGHLFEEGYFLLNPFAEFTSGNYPKRLEMPILSREQVQIILNAPDLSTPLGLRNQAIFELAYGSGLRLGELGSLTLSSIDLRERFVHLKDTKNKWDRRVPITHSGASALREYLKRARPLLLGPDCGHSLWVGCRGKVLQDIGLSAVPRTYLSTTNFHFSMHDFRRAFATHLLEGGAQVAEISELLGHRCIESSMHYAKALLVELQKVHKLTHPKG